MWGGPEGLELPEPPRGIAYVDYEDAYSRALLEANGIEPTPEGLQAALDAELEVIQAAAARVLGVEQERRAAPRLRELATGRGDSVRAEAGYALARMGDPAGRESLMDTLALPAGAYVAPMQAAGALARLGDPSGARVIDAALRDSNPIIRMVACKQLLYFAPLDGADLGDGRLDVEALFERALADSDPEVAGQAEAQQHELRTR
jgi:HEAT repeat protein